MPHTSVGAAPRTLSSEMGTIVMTSVTLSKGVAAVAEGVTVKVTVTVTAVGGSSEELEEETPAVVVDSSDVDVADVEVLDMLLLVVVVVANDVVVVVVVVVVMVDVRLLDIVVVVKLALEKPDPVGPTADVVLKTGKGGADVVVGRAMELVVEAVELVSTNPGPGMGSVASCPY